jgi:hypothetical protein
LEDGQIITRHGGAAAGHNTFIGFNRNTSTGVVILYNCSGDPQITREIGQRILEIAAQY